MKVLIIGSGLVGTALARAFSMTSDIDVFLYNRTAEAARKIANELTIDHVKELAQTPEVDLVILAVSDLSIQEIILPDQLMRAMIVHTSGAQSIQLLEKHPRHGLFYPLDSFGYEGDHLLKDTPILIDANSSTDLKFIRGIASKLSGSVYHIQESDRQNVHLAAVFTNNFVNALLNVSHEIITNNKIPEDILNKLLATTVLKAQQIGPQQSQTGPARRGDLNTIKAHLALLKDDRLQQIYRELSKLINPELKDQMK